MKLAVVGSRSFNDYELLKNKLSKYSNISLIISGGAPGADSLSRRYALENKIPLMEFLPDWQAYGKAAGPIRNEQIIKECQQCLALWDGKSKGTENSISLCKKLSRPVEIVYFKGQLAFDFH